MAVQKNTSLPKELFEQEVNQALLRQYIHVYRTNQRQGNASTKDRSQIIGTTKKVYKQKGTGNARHGSRKASIYVGGGVVGGPKPRDYTLSMSQQQRKTAMISALSQVRENVFVVTDGEVTSLDGKTKSMIKLLMTHKAYPKKTLIVTKNDEQVTSAKRASANLSQVTLMQVGSLSAYDVLNYPVVLFTTSALDELQKKLI